MGDAIIPAHLNALLSTDLYIHHANKFCENNN